MDFRELTYIVAIAKHGSITRAARELYVSQPTLSKFVQSIERDLGQPLFRRLGNKFMLTYAGEKYLGSARTILDLKRRLDQELADILKKNIGELKIAFPVMRGAYMLPRSLPVFHARYPEVKVTVLEANSSRLEGMIIRGEIDVAFFNMPIRHPDIGHTEIANEEVLLIVSAEHPLADEGVPRDGCSYPWIDIRRFRNDEFILQVPGQRTRQMADSIFQETGIKPPVLLALRNIYAGVQLAANNYGVSLITGNHLRHIYMERPFRCFCIGEPKYTLEFVAAFRKGVYLPQYTWDFIQIVKDFY